MNERNAGRLIIVVLGAVSLACAGAPVVTPTAAPTAAPTASQSIALPTASATSAPTTAPTVAISPTPPTTAAPDYLEMPSANCCRGRDLDAGRYVFPRWLGIPLTVDVHDGWRVMNERAALLFVIGRGENVHLNPSQIILFLDATGRGTPQTIIDGIHQVPQLSEVAQPSDVTLAGFAGVQADMAALPNPDFEGIPADDIPPGVQYLPVIESYLAPGFAWTTSSAEARVRTVALTVGEQVLLIYLEAPANEFDALAADAETLLGSLEPELQ